jgi:RimJ/RimL family protein N-acetyltransferase
MHETTPLPLVTLEGVHVRLEPLTLDHAPDLLAAASESRDTYGYTWVPDSEASTEAYIRAALAEQEAGRARPFATRRMPDNAVVGCTRFCTIEHWAWEPGNPHCRMVESAEIGWTWLSASAQRTPINTEAKYLMLRHAFETWQCHRVQLTTDERNLQSRNAIQRIGAQFEGVLRANRPGSDGIVRSTAYFSIVQSEWPGVKSMLEAKLRSRPDDAPEAS